jgi:hypothetical protein
MKNIQITVLSLMTICLLACINSGYEESDIKSGYIIHFDKIKTSIDLILSDLEKNFKLIRLETTKESLLGKSDFFIEIKYIMHTLILIFISFHKREDLSINS